MDKGLKLRFLLSALTLLFIVSSARAQVIDEIVAVIGNEIVLYSDIQIQKSQIKAQGFKGTLSDCQVLEEILFEKLMLNQAKVDSLEVTDDMVQGQLNRRMDVFIRQIGSVEALEDYYGKSMSEIREDFFDVLKDQLMVQRMESEISADINVTPSDVQEFFNEIPKDSLPYVNASVEMAQIVKYPSVSTKEKERVRSRLMEFKEQVETGQEEFETLAALYSDDPGSAAKGGRLGMQARGTWVPEFDAVAFNLEDGQISTPFKTDYGFHIMQLLDRRGEMYDANHLLLIPEVSSDGLNRARTDLDSIRTLVVRDSVSFALAANKYSDDELTKNQNGSLVNQASGSTIFEMDDIDPTLFPVIDTMEVGAVSKPFYFQTRSNEKGYRIVKLMNRTEPHRANLTDDYQSLQNMATERLRAQAMDKWVRERIDEAFVKIDEKYRDCAFGYPWIEEDELIKN
ncbi:MAG: peptidyl-prolyl cis-trans isomerase SurA [Cryomorphaceae bacterium]|jgi:peptidyl-prolyl cis-trans isomerase SurA